jgi:hypothetical protein
MVCPKSTRKETQSLPCSILIIHSFLTCCLQMAFMEYEIEGSGCVEPFSAFTCLLQNEPVYTARNTRPLDHLRFLPLMLRRGLEEVVLVRLLLIMTRCYIVKEALSNGHPTGTFLHHLGSWY